LAAPESFDDVSGNKVAPAKLEVSGAGAGAGGVVFWMVYGIPGDEGQSQLLPPTHVQPGPPYPQPPQPGLQLPQPPQGAPPCASTATAVKDVTKRIASKIASIIFILVDDCFNIYFTPYFFIFIYFSCDILQKLIFSEAANFSVSGLDRYMVLYGTYFLPAKIQIWIIIIQNEIVS
jgi:hypothetical protein